MIVRPHPGANKGRPQQRLLQRIKQAKSYGLQKRAPILERAHGVSIQVPLRNPRLLELGLGHKLIRTQAVASLQSSVVSETIPRPSRHCHGENWGYELRATSKP